MTSCCALPCWLAGKQLVLCQLSTTCSVKHQTDTNGLYMAISKGSRNDFSLFKQKSTQVILNHAVAGFYHYPFFNTPDLTIRLINNAPWVSAGFSSDRKRERKSTHFPSKHSPSKFASVDSHSLMLLNSKPRLQAWLSLWRNSIISIWLKHDTLIQ